MPSGDDPAPPERSILRRAVDVLGPYGAALGVQRLAGFVIVPVLTWTIGPSELGAFAVVATLAIFTFMTLVDLGIGTIAFRLSADEGASPDAIFGTVLYVRLAAASLLGVPILLGADAIGEAIVGRPDAGLAVSLGWATMLLRAFTQTMTDWLRHRRRDREVALFVAALGVLEAALAAVLVLGLGLGFTGWMAALVVAQVVTSLPLLARCRPAWTRHGGLGTLRALLRLGLPIGVMQSLYALRDLDRFLVGHLASLSDAGVYDIAVKLAAPLGTLNTVLVLALEPHTLSTRDPAATLRRAGAFFRVYATLTTASAFAIAMLTPEVLLLVEPRYRDAAPVAGALLFLPTLEGLRRLLGLPLDLAKQTRGWIAVSVINGLLALGVAWLLVPRFGGAGAAIGLLGGAAAGAIAVSLFAAPLEHAAELGAPRLRALALGLGGAALAFYALSELSEPLATLPHRLGCAIGFAALIAVVLPAGREAWAKMGSA